MPVIINDFEVVNDEPTRTTQQTRQPVPAAPSPPREETASPTSLARRLAKLRARRARLHAD